MLKHALLVLNAALCAAALPLATSVPSVPATMTAPAGGVQERLYRMPNPFRLHSDAHGRGAEAGSGTGEYPCTLSSARARHAAPWFVLAQIG